MTVAELNLLNSEEKRALFTQCCGSSAWVEKMLCAPQSNDVEALLKIAEDNWHECNKQDWLEAFQHHPKIGDINSLKEKFAGSVHLASSEQSGVTAATENTLKGLAQGNDDYEKKFGYIFIVCATGKSAEELLAILASRLPNPPEEEIKIAAEEQNKITKLRLQKLFA